MQHRKPPEERAALPRTGNREKKSLLDDGPDSDLERSDNDEEEATAGQRALDVEEGESDGESCGGESGSSNGDGGEEMIYEHDVFESAGHALVSGQAAFEVPDDELRVNFRQLDDVLGEVEWVHGAKGRLESLEALRGAFDGVASLLGACYRHFG